MKRTLIIAILAATAAVNAYAWKPIFVGHRGSYCGVANTVEAFRNGAEYYKYDGLECDVRVTSDGQYVICHDETTASLCDQSLTIANSTLEELQALTLTQTRGGVTYTGKICTVAEYLDICVEYDVFPMIELKWTTGINTNDMSNFAGLYQLVKDRGLEDKAIFLTSMLASLRHIRTNYPGATCQYLLSSDSETKFNACVENDFNPSFEASALTEEIALKYRTAGLDVAVWTVNSEANYKKYGAMGAFMMTCDYLRPEEMPELDEPTIPEPAPDPVALEGSALWTRSSVQGNLPANYPDKGGETYTTGEMAAVVDGVFYVSDYGTRSILLFDQECTDAIVIPQSDTEFGGTPMHGICTDDAQNLILRYEETINATPSKVRLFRYGSSVPVEVEFQLTCSGGNHFVSACGDVFSQEGGYIYFLPNRSYTVARVHIANGALVDVQEYTVSIAGSTASWIMPMESPDKFIYMVRSDGYYLWDGEDKGSYFTSSTSTSQPSRNSSCGGAYLSIGGHEILCHPSGTNYNGGFAVRDITGGNTPLLTFDPLGTTGYTANASTGTFMKPVRMADDYYYLYNYTMGHGYGLYEIKAEGAVLPNSGVTAPAVAEKVALNVFPNPARDVAAISSTKALGKVMLHSLDGRLVGCVDFGDATLGRLDLSQVAPGMLLATTDDGRTTRLIKIR